MCLFAIKKISLFFLKAEFPPVFMGPFCEMWFCFHRLDTTLIDFTDMKCQRGDLSFIFNGDAAPSESFVVLDNEQKVYQRIHHEVKLWEGGGTHPRLFWEYIKQNLPQKDPKNCKPKSFFLSCSNLSCEGDVEFCEENQL